MNKKNFEVLSDKYRKPIINIIDSDVKYTNIDETIKWTFGWDNDPAITATVNRKTNVLSINVVFVDRSYNDNRLFDLEYFLLHEMRHVYQNIQIKKYKENNHELDSHYIEKWIKEGDCYIKSVDQAGHVNDDYFRQDCELDAYAFSYAVMKYKYNGRYDDELFIPEIYKSELKEEYETAVEDFTNHFNEFIK